MSFECFQHIVNWVVDESNPSRNRSTPFQMWYKGARASSGTCVTVSTVVGCDVLYLFSEASEMKDCKLLGVQPSTFHSYADMVVEEIFSRSSEVICFPPKDKQVRMMCSMMDAPFPVLSSLWMGRYACCQPRTIQRVLRKEESAADECSGRLRLEYESGAHRQQFYRQQPGQHHVHVFIHELSRSSCF